MAKKKQAKRKTVGKVVRKPKNKVKGKTARRTTTKQKKAKSKKQSDKTNYFLFAILALCIMGIVISAYLAYGHYTSVEEFCIGGEKGGQALCDVVNQSVYAEVFGFPMAGLGFLGYLSMFFFALLLLKPQKGGILGFLSRHADSLLIAFITFSIAMKLYFNYLQFFVLKTICVLCETSAAIIILLTILIFWRAKKQKLHIEKYKIGIFFFLIIATFMSLFVILSNHHAFYRDTNLDGFAECLSQKEVEFFGTFWCPSCGEVKKTMGSAFQYIDYVECDYKGENPQTERCMELNIEKYPTWIDSSGNRLDAEKDLTKVSAFFNCPFEGNQPENGEN